MVAEITSSLACDMAYQIGNGYWLHVRGTQTHLFQVQ